MAETDPSKSGLSTSEGKLTLVVMIVGGLLEAVAGVLHALQDAGAAAPWFPSVLSVVGVLLMLASSMGYTKARTVLKATMVTSEAPTAVLPPK